MLSVIVPVYNVEKYLDKCILSILNQTVENLEIILVDDGSTDSSGALCDMWAQKDRRIKVFHKPNGGLMSAWKYGVRKAAGTYIGFVDSDDWIDANMYEQMLAVAAETGTDLVCASFVREYEDGRQSFAKNILEPGLYNRERILTDISPYLFISRKYHDRILYPNRWSKLFKRELLLPVLEDCDERVTIGEDLVVFFSYLQLAESLYVLDGFWPYHYRINSASMIQSFSSIKYEKIDILRQTLLSLNDKYHTYDYRTQIYTDYLDLYFRTVENQILSSSDDNLIQSLRVSFSAESIEEAIAMSDQSMLSKKYRLYLLLMKCDLIRAVVLIRRMKSLMK